MIIKKSNFMLRKLDIDFINILIVVNRQHKVDKI